MSDDLTDEQRERLRAKIAALKEQRATKPRPRYVKLPAPIYDEVFYEGTAALDRDGGDPYILCCCCNAPICMEPTEEANGEVTCSACGARLAWSIQVASALTDGRLQVLVVPMPDAAPDHGGER